MFRRSLLATALAVSGCSLLCPIGGPQPCGASGECLPGYVCQAGLCVGGGSGGSGGGGGCATSCPAGACVGSACANGLVAWGDGGPLTASVGCFPYPPAESPGSAAVPLAGCVETLPGDSLADAGAPTIQLLGPGGTPLGNALPLLADAGCPSGWGYALSAPPGELVTLSVAATGEWATTPTPVFVPPGGGRRDVGAISANGWSREIGAVEAALDVPKSQTSSLVVGLVRDCAGHPLSGVQVATTPAALGVAYLDAAAAPAAGRTATGESGRFALVAAPGTYTVQFSTAPPAQALGGVTLTVSPAAAAWIDVAPAGP